MIEPLDISMCPVYTHVPAPVIPTWPHIYPLAPGPHLIVRGKSFMCILIGSLLSKFFFSAEVYKLGPLDIFVSSPDVHIVAMGDRIRRLLHEFMHKFNAYEIPSLFASDIDWEFDDLHR